MLFGPFASRSSFSEEFRLQKIDLGTDWSIGDRVGGHSSPPPAHKLRMFDGTQASPVKIGSTTEINRVETTTRAELDEMGPVGTDGPDGVAALRVASKGIPGCEVQVTGIMGTAWQASEGKGVGTGADACPLYGFGRTSGAASGTAFGAYLEATREVAHRAIGLEVRLRTQVIEEENEYVPNGPSTTMGIWMNAQSLGNKSAACAFQLGKNFGASFDVGIGINENAVTGAGFRDDSSSARSVYIRGTHSKAAIAIASGSGAIVIGGNELGTASARLEINGAAETMNPLVDIGSGANNNVYGLRVRNVSGNASLFVAAGVNNVLTGTAQGDTGIGFTPTKIFHIGATGKTSLFRMSETGLGFFGKAPVARPNVAAALTVTAKELCEALETLGLIE